MFVYNVIHRSVQPEDQWPSGEATELKGSFTTFDAACEAARKSLSRKKEDYTYYNEGRTDDESVYSEHESDDEDFGHEDESDREEDDFCIRTFHDYGDTERIWVEKVELMTGAKSEAKQEKVLPLSSSAIPPSASSSVDRDPTRQRAKCARCAEDEGDITVYHVVRTVSDDGGREDEILGSYRRFKDARRTARESLLGDDPSAYHLYVEGRLSQGHDYSLQSRGVVKYRNDEEDDPRGDTDFCIYAVDLEGNHETIRVEEGTLHACLSDGDDQMRHDTSKIAKEAVAREQTKENPAIQAGGKDSKLPSSVPDLKRKVDPKQTKEVLNAKRAKQVIEIDSSSEDE